MRSFSSLAATATLVAGLGLASTVEAATLEWSGTLTVKMPLVGDPPPFRHFGTGVATVNGSAGGIGHINTIRLHHGLSYTGGNNVPETIPLTGPENPTVVTLRATGMRLGRAGGMSNALTLNGISGGAPLGTKNTGQPPGNMKMCFLFPGCGIYWPISFGKDASNAVGVGGMFTVNAFPKVSFRFSVWGAPWTIGLASIANVTTETPNGGITTYTKTIQGFVHGPASGTSSTAAISGVLQVVTPVLIKTNRWAGPGGPEYWQAAWFEVRLRFIPEPELLLLLGSGAAGLLMLGRFRMRN
jgi:hypothetical protein